jgi:NAD(P)-dependent dehydrogenase (short-subunit alcohol dehydrogenase family)
VAQGIRQSGGEASVCQADIGTEHGVMALYAAADASGIPLAGFVNNRCVGCFARLEVLLDAMLRRVLAINVAGAMLCAREAVRPMSRNRGGQGGSIVNVSSIAIKLGSAGEWVEQGRDRQVDDRPYAGGGGRRHPGERGRAGSGSHGVSCCSGWRQAFG